jgi:UDP-N-acetylglucosamine 2-epimerase
MKICTVIGARPQFIKAAAVSRAIADHNRLALDALPLTPDSLRFTEIIIHTGQHYDDNMSAVFFEELQIPTPHYNLGIGSGSHGRQTGDMLTGIESILLKEKPDWVLVYGDTNSTLAGALAAAKLHIKIAHVEAGLRSFNRRMPEEINRVLTDHLSTLLLCPSQTAVDNLTVEGITNSSGFTSESSRLTPHVSIVGDVMADAMKFALSKRDKHTGLLANLDVSNKGYLLVTIHRAENTDDRERFVNILSAFDCLEEPVLFPVHPRSKKLLNETGYKPPMHVKLIEPVGYFDMIVFEQSARMILTDSGGVQKEAYWLKVPCITLRDETEWIETVEAGWNVLTGADPEKIIRAIRSFTPPAKHPLLFGDGNAAAECLLAMSDVDERSSRATIY